MGDENGDIVALPQAVAISHKTEFEIADSRRFIVSFEKGDRELFQQRPFLLRHIPILEHVSNIAIMIEKKNITSGHKTNS